MGMEVPIARLFQYPTISSLAVYLDTVMDKKDWKQEDLISRRKSRLSGEMANAKNRLKQRRKRGKEQENRKRGDQL